MTTAIIPGSIGAIAKQEGKSLAETFINADVIVIVDTSGSMSEEDSRGNKSRYDVACEELATLQASLPGKIGVFAFSSSTIFCPGGQPPYLGAKTNLVGALQFVKVADVANMRFIVISDGEPDDPDKALKIASTYKNRIDVIYVGNETFGYGRAFLQKLAEASGGQAVTADRAKELAPTIQKLLLS
jgi:hypothetical protein